jgi:hypothetical protein
MSMLSYNFSITDRKSAATAVTIASATQTLFMSNLFGIAPDKGGDVTNIPHGQ